VETRIPPPLLILLLGAGAWWLARAWPEAGFPLPWHNALALVAAMIGIALNLAPKIAFQRAATTVNPMRPQAANALVRSGLHRWSRNPMYLGQAMIVLAWALHLQHALAFAMVPAYVLYIGRFQVRAEERALRERFGRDYDDYCRRVPRWL
jgi:protein-S-isoprenylcysteine O-methyltransferase Ste14